jgi:NAD-dependent deacetylase
VHFDLAKYRNVVVLTGAGISAGSGLRTYRGPDGVWEEHQVEEYGHVDTFQHQPEKTWQLFGSMRTPVSTAVPNDAHLALVHLESRLHTNQKFLLVTQNVDGLHQKSGSQKVVELHGNLCTTRCSNENCDFEPFQDEETHSSQLPRCPKCSSVLRPDIVLFGETIPHLAAWTVKKALRDCDLFLAIGTSGLVYPAANFVRSAEYVGARTIYVNLEPMNPRNPAFKEEYLGKAEEILPKLISPTMR